MSARQRARLLQSKHLSNLIGVDSGSGDELVVPRVQKRQKKSKKVTKASFHVPISSSDDDEEDEEIVQQIQESLAETVVECSRTVDCKTQQMENILDDCILTGSDEDSDLAVKKHSTFLELVDSSSSSDDDLHATKLQGDRYNPSSKIGRKQKQNISLSGEDITQDENVEDFLDEFVKKNEQLESQIGGPTTSLAGRLQAIGVSESILQITIDPKQMSWDQVIRNRFGAGGIGEQVNNNNNLNQLNNRNRSNNSRTNRLHASKRWLFGQPDEDWSKPPSIVGGGMGMTRIHTEFIPYSSTKEILYNVFSFQWSKEYSKIAHLYQIAKSTGDANYLVMFLANYPYYAEGFLDLAYIFCQMGQTERGIQCLRRVLYLYECASMEAFRPHLGQSRLLFFAPKLKKSLFKSFTGKNDSKTETNDSEDDDGSASDDDDKNDTDIKEFSTSNQIYLRTLWRFMQVVDTQGHHQLSANLAKMILSLNPTDDEVNILLSLDFYLLQVGEFEKIVQMCGMYPTNNSFTDSCKNDNDEDEDKVLVTRTFDSSSSDGDSDSDEDHNETTTMETSPVRTKELLNSPQEKLEILLRRHWEHAYIIDSMELPSISSPEDGIEIQYSIEKLPNWWFSLAVSVFLSVLDRELVRQYDTTRQETDIMTKLWSRTTANSLLQQALRRWPLVAWEIFVRNYSQQDTLSSTGVHCGQLYQRMQPLSFYFLNNSHRDNLKKNMRNSKLQPPLLQAYEEHMISCYLTKCGRADHLWARREIWSWFVLNLEQMVATMEQIVTLEENKQSATINVELEIAITAFHGLYSGSDSSPSETANVPALEGENTEICPLNKYLRAELVDFEPEIPRLRVEGVQPIDAQLLEERVLLGGVKFKKLDKHLLSMKSQMQWRKHYGRWITEQGHHTNNTRLGQQGSTFGYILDLTLPLLQLFLLSLFPWMVLPPTPPHLRPQQPRQHQRP